MEIQSTTEIGIELKEEEFGSIKTILQEAVKSSILQENRLKARETAWQHQGESGERTAEFLVKKMEQIAKERK